MSTESNVSNCNVPVFSVSLKLNNIVMSMFKEYVNRDHKFRERGYVKTLLMHLFNKKIVLVGIGSRSDNDHDDYLVDIHLYTIYSLGKNNVSR